MARRPDPNDFDDMPAARHHKSRGHLVDAIAQDAEQARNGQEDTRTRAGTPDKPDKPGVPPAPEHKATRTTRGGEVVRRATFWLTERDLETIQQLQRVVDLPHTSGVPDKSAIVREAVRRLAANALKDGDQAQAS